MTEPARSYALSLLRGAALYDWDKDEMELDIHQIEWMDDLDPVINYLEAHRHRTMDLYAPNQTQITRLISHICGINS